MKVKVKKRGNSQGLLLSRKVLSEIGIDSVDLDLEITKN